MTGARPMSSSASSMSLRRSWTSGLSFDACRALRGDHCVGEALLQHEPPFAPAPIQWRQKLQSVRTLARTFSSVGLLRYARSVTTTSTAESVANLYAPTVAILSGVTIATASADT